MENWVLISIMAAAFQTVRFMLQKHLAGAALSATGATFARFVYSAPLVAVLLAAYMPITGQFPAVPGLWFWIYALCGGFTQVLATVCVVAVFASRNFAVGITLMKTETILTAFVGFLILGEVISVFAFAVILVGLVGVLLLSDVPQAEGRFLRRITNRAAGLGLLSGVLFSVSAVGYRAASLQVVVDDPVLRAMVTLAVVTASQMIGMAIWMAFYRPGQMARVFGAWRVAIWVGLMSMAGSLCWFTAFTLQNATYVKAVGQIELIFSIIASVLFFKEKITRKEILGITLLSVSVLSLVLHL